MISQKKKTALMVFSLSAKNEAERKPVFGNNRKNTSSDFFKILINRTANLAKASGIDVIWLGENLQKGNSFAERYTNAFKDLFAQGYDNIVSIGNDTPDLSLRTVKTAILKLQEEKMVLGPSSDGGVYLLGLNKAVFNAAEFQKLPWLKSNLFKTLTRKAKSKKITFHSSQLLSDIDSLEDIISYVERNPNSAISKFVLPYLHLQNKHLPLYKKVYYSFLTPELLSHRGPPSA